jgi:CheY-like chemotaxis protein
MNKKYNYTSSIKYLTNKYEFSYDDNMNVIKDLKIILGQKKPEQQLVADKEPKKTILIVEDDPILLEMYKDKFTNEGYTVLTAKNGKMGLETVIAQKPDIILLDLMMPVMNGKEMLRKIRKFPQFKRLPVIILTNAGDVENIRETKRYDDACEFFIKSNISIDEIVEKANFWINAII